MNAWFQELRDKVIDLKKSLAAAENTLQVAEGKCPHQWTAIQPDHIYHESYTIPGDPPGVGGVDHQFPCHVPASTEKRWKRTCTVCGRVEHTNRTAQKITEHLTFD